MDNIDDFDDTFFPADIEEDPIYEEEVSPAAEHPPPAAGEMEDDIIDIKESNQEIFNSSLPPRIRELGAKAKEDGAAGAAPGAEGAAAEAPGAEGEKKPTRSLLPPIKHSMLFDNPEGFAQLKKDFAGFKHRGKGHESEDLKRVVVKFENWGKTFYTQKIQPNDLFKKIEGVLGTVEKRTQIGEADSNPVIEMWKWRYKHTFEKQLDVVHKEAAEKKKQEEAEEKKRIIAENKRKAMAKRAARLAREGKAPATGSTDVPGENVPPRAAPEPAGLAAEKIDPAATVDNPMMLYGNASMKQKIAENKARALERRRLFQERVGREQEAAAAAPPGIPRPFPEASTASTSIPKTEEPHDIEVTMPTSSPATDVNLRPGEGGLKREAETQGLDWCMESIPAARTTPKVTPRNYNPPSQIFDDLDMGEAPQHEEEEPQGEEPPKGQGTKIEEVQETEGSYGYNTETYKIREESFAVKIPKPKPDGLTAEDRKRAFREKLAKEREEMINEASLRMETQVLEATRRLKTETKNRSTTVTSIEEPSFGLEKLEEPSFFGIEKSDEPSFFGIEKSEEGDAEDSTKQEEAADDCGGLNPFEKDSDSVMGFPGTGGAWELDDLNTNTKLEEVQDKSKTKVEMPEDVEMEDAEGCFDA